MEQQPALSISQADSSKKRQQYSQDDMMHIAELYEEYYLRSNTRGNVLSSQRVQINKAHWTALTEEYNVRQEALPRNEGFVRSEKALVEKWGHMKKEYQKKKADIRSTGSGGGPISGYLKKMHDYLHDDPQFFPVVVHSSMKRQYIIRDDDVEIEEQQDTASSSSSALCPSERSQKRARTVVQEKEDSQVKAREEALSQFREIQENAASRLDAIMSRPLVVQIVESDEKKEFYKKFLELFEKGLQ